MGGAVTHAICIRPGGGDSHFGEVGACNGEGSRTRGGLGGAKLGGLNPRPLRETRPTNPAGEDLVGAASSGAAEVLLLTKDSAARSADEERRDAGVHWLLVVAVHLHLKHSNFCFELQLVRAEARNA